MYEGGFKAHLRWLELRSQNKMVHCKCDQCILDNAPQTNDKEYIQGSQKIAHTSHQLHWDEVLKAQKIILTKKHQFPPLMQKPKKKKPDHGSLNDIKLFSVQVPDVLPNPKSDYLLMKNINKINKNKNKNPAPDE
jgi:hypothetical protein